jgi:metal-responsive CopG/Arc/MetJ family transcriptional regulator
MSITKLTVTISSDNYREIEEKRKKQNLSRSAFVDRILRAYFEGKMKDELIKRYMEGYIKIPEDTNESNALVEAQSPVLGEFK